MTDDWPREVTMEIDDPEIWDRITTGRLTGFSIAPEEGVEVNWEEMALRQDYALHDYAKRAAESFADYVVKEAGLHVTTDEFDSDTVRECIERLYENGYKITDRADEDGKRGIGYVHPRLFESLLDDWHEMVRFGPNPDEVQPPKQLGAYGVDVWADESFNDGVGVVFHPDATAPYPPSHALGPPRGILDASLTPRPWLVKDPDGVVVVELDA